MSNHWIKSEGGGGSDGVGSNSDEINDKTNTFFFNIQCTICGSMFENNEELESHQSSEHTFRPAVKVETKDASPTGGDTETMVNDSLSMMMTTVAAANSNVTQDGELTMIMASVDSNNDNCRNGIYEDDDQPPTYQTLSNCYYNIDNFQSVQSTIEVQEPNLNLTSSSQVSANNKDEQPRQAQTTQQPQQTNYFCALQIPNNQLISNLSTQQPVIAILHNQNFQTVSSPSLVATASSSTTSPTLTTTEPAMAATATTPAAAAAAATHYNVIQSSNHQLNILSSSANNIQALTSLSAGQHLACLINGGETAQQQTTAAILHPSTSASSSNNSALILQQTTSSNPISNNEIITKQNLVFAKQTVSGFEIVNGDSSNSVACSVEKRVNDGTGMGVVNSAPNVGPIKDANGMLTDSEGRFLCPECEKAFERKKYLKEHLKLHASNDKHPCDQCHKSFINATQLKNHQQIDHSGPRFVCTTCKKVFKSRSLLKNHEKIHTKDQTNKPTFPCDTCSRVFGQRAHLVVHMRTHNNERPFGCNVCGRQFVQNDHLIEHSRMHSEEFGYKCPIHPCPKAYRQEKEYRKHLRVTHKLRWSKRENLLIPFQPAPKPGKEQKPVVKPTIDFLQIATAEIFD